MVLDGTGNGSAMADEDRHFWTSGGLGSRSTAINRPQMYGFTWKKNNGFAMADSAWQFGTSGVWGLDPPPLGEAERTVL